MQSLNSGDYTNSDEKGLEMATKRRNGEKNNFIEARSDTDDNLLLE